MLEVGHMYMVRDKDEWFNFTRIRIWDRPFIVLSHDYKCNPPTGKPGNEFKYRVLCGDEEVTVWFADIDVVEVK